MDRPVSKTRFQRLLMPLICVVIIVGAVLRFDHVDQIYDEYDDVGVIAIQKVPLDSVKRDINFGPIKSIQLDGSYLANIETTVWYGLFMGRVWTYSPGQYALASLFLSGEMTARQRHIALRCLSGIVSVMTIVLLAFFLARQSPGDSNERWLILPITALLSFSTNTILYSMHASPYSFYGFALLAALVVAGRALEGRGRFYYACLALSVLCLFNYLVVLVLVSFLGIALFVSTTHGRRNAIADISNAPIPFLGRWLLVGMPLLVMVLLLKADAGARGVAMPHVDSLGSLLTALDVLQTQVRLVAFNTLYGGLPSRWMTSLLVLGGGIAAILSLRSWISNRNYSALLTVSLLGGWGFLYILHKLPFDQSRHTLMLLPPFCLLLFWSIRPLVLRVPAFVMIAASIAMTISISVAGYSNAKEAFGPRKAMLTKQTIEKHAPDFVLTYGFTLGPIVDFYDSDVQAINLDLRSSLYFDWKAIDDSKRIMLVSQTKPMTETQLEGLRKRFPDLFENRNLVTISENSTGVFFPFHSYPLSSNQNGAYIYHLSK